MKASLPILSPASDSPASFSGLETEFAGIQGDRAISAGFPALLEEAHAAFYTEFGAAPPGAADTLNPPQQLQILPWWKRRAPPALHRGRYCCRLPKNSTSRARSAKQTRAPLLSAYFSRCWMSYRRRQ